MGLKYVDLILKKTNGMDQLFFASPRCVLQQ